MNGTGRHTTKDSGSRSATERAARQAPPGRRRPLPGAGVGRRGRRLSLTALAAGAVAATAIAAAVAASGSAGGGTAAARLTGEVGPDAAASSPATAWAYVAPALIGAGHAVLA